MTVKKIREKARIIGVKNYSRLTKPDLIRAIQQTEGNTGCFKGIWDCREERCLWREECQS